MHSKQVRIYQLDFLVNNLKSSNWVTMISMSFMVAFCYFYLDAAPLLPMAIWLLLNLLVTLVRTFLVYPRYNATQITVDNVDKWWFWFTGSIFVTSLAWSVGLPFLFDYNNYNLVLVLMFAFFTLLASATQSLASHRVGFAVFATPLVVTVLALCFSSSQVVFTQLGIAFTLFSLFTLSLYRNTNRDITKLISLQLEKQELANELEIKNQQAEHSRKQAENSVVEKNHFLAAASHDLRQPLHATGMLLEVLKDHVASSKGRTILSQINEANEALTNSFNSLLDISKLDANVVDVTMANIELNRVMAQIHNELTHYAQQKQLNFNVEGPDLFVYSDELLLQRILRNLIGNAISYTAEGSVTVSWHLTNNGSDIEIVIADTGIGIAADQIDNIFQEYYQVRGVDNGPRKGFGLGLAIVRRLGKLLSMDIELESTLGQGTQFRFSLPRGEQVTPSEQHSHTQSTPLNGMQILVIDDDELVRQSLSELLTSWQCRVIAAAGVADAVASVSTLGSNGQFGNGVDLILSDYQLHGNEIGVDACAAVIEAQGRPVPSAIITGDTSLERLQTIKGSGFHVMHKPVSPHRLRSYLIAETLNQLDPIASDPAAS